MKKLQAKMQIYLLFSSNYIYFCKRQKADEKKKVTFEELNHRLSQAKCQLVQTSYIKRIKWFLFLPYNKHLNSRPKSVCMGES